MTQLNRYIARTVSSSVFAVLVVIVSLDVIAGLIDQLSDMRGDYDFKEVFVFVGLSIPSTVYEYLPLSALVGCLIGLGVLASSSELVVMRASGVSVGRIIWAVARPVFVFIFFGSLVGEFLAPYSDQYADSRRALARGHKVALQSERGKWHREGNEFMHFNAILPNGKLYGITRFRFDSEGALVESSFVDSAIYQGGHWVEQDGQVSTFVDGGIEESTFNIRHWDNQITPSLLSDLLLGFDDLPMRRLHAYANYLNSQNLDADKYRLAFWQKALQPLATLSLMMIAISFVLGPLRQVTMGFRVFSGVIVGLVFQTSQKMLGPSSLIWGFPPLLAVLIPIIFCLLVGWLLIRRSE
ncbi:MAG: LPS export ABC transporter permease LptG [Alteromonadaceae bacterium]|nr:MAG: LPS export ABC transporter permease LptG [Alteromonadaceae bacterium]